MSSEVDRPDPDLLLARIRDEETAGRRGKLKIFFGSVAGVGKTCAMLQAGKQKAVEGLDVVAGWIETHGRTGTAALLEGYEVLPPKDIDYRGVMLREFNLDLALTRHPDLILVDELAHNNVQGSRHPKRWQDIEELLEAGIDVYTTVNVQHLESLNDDVGQIAGVRIRETVPDKVFDQADEVSLIDLPARELLDRLRDGKIYREEQARKAAKNFFKEGNLIALRELALRQTTQRVDAQMQVYRENHAIHEVWPVADRVMVCIGPTAMAERLIRAGKRFASALRAEWVVVYVETPELERLSAERRDRVLRMLKLAEELGAETATLSGTDMSDEIIRFARGRNISKIMMGKPARRGVWRWMLGSVVDTIISRAHNINVYLLGSPVEGDGESTTDGPRLYMRPPAPGLFQGRVELRFAHLKSYLLSLGVTTLSTLLAWGMASSFSQVNIVMMYLLGVLFVAMRLGRGPAILASALGVSAFDFFFVEPYFSFSVTDIQYLLTFLVILVVGFTTSHLMDRIRYQARVASHRERRSTLLYTLTRELASSRTVSEALQIALLGIYREFGGRVVFLLPNEEGILEYPSAPPLEHSLKGAEIGVAQWVYQHNEVAGKGTHTLSGATAVYVPMPSQSQEEDRVAGVLVIDPPNLRRVFLPEQRKLLDTIIGLVVQTVHRHILTDQARATLVEVESERLRNSLLTSVSHDFRTPLATILGASGALIDPSAAIAEDQRNRLLGDIHDEAERMVQLVNNILDLARYESEKVEPKRDWYPVDEILASLMGRVRGRLEGRPIEIHVTPKHPALVYVDAVMIEQVLVNLIENACRYSPPHSTIRVEIERSWLTFSVSVIDQGPGIPQGQESRIFDKFFGLGTQHHGGGSGLGLAICKAIVDAHKGGITARNRAQGGAEFSFTISMPQGPES
jgi:two-component system, OmpR family, sensor histidine kinase KdpD